MENKYKEEVFSALMEITGVQKINTEISLILLTEKFSEKIGESMSMDDLLCELCMKLGKRVANNAYLAQVGDLIIDRYPHSWNMPTNNKR